MAAKPSEDWTLVLSDDEDDKEKEQAKDSVAKISDDLPEKSSSLDAKNPKEPVPATLVEQDDKKKTSETSVENSQSVESKSDQKKMSEDPNQSSSKSDEPSPSLKSDDNSSDGNKTTGGDVEVAVDAQTPTAGDDADGGETKKDEDEGTGDESIDSDKTIDMDPVDFEKAVGEDDHAVEAKDAEGKIQETQTSQTVDKKSSELQKDGDNQEKNKQEKEQTVDPRKAEKKQTVDSSGATKVTTVSEKVKADASSTGAGEKEGGARGAGFRSLDLPIHPVHEARRGRPRQRSEEHPLERSPSVASNRSEDSSGTGSSKQRRKERQSAELVESPRERRKSGASTTGNVKMVRPGFELRAGFKLQAQDFSDKWYSAKIVQVDEEDNTLLIHFDGWNSRFDEWMDYKSDRLRPAPRRETSPVKVYNVGDTVLARWSDTRYYQGKIRGINANGSYRVRFYDGLEKSVQAGNIREMPEELRPIVSPKGYGIGDEVLARWNDCRYYPAKILSIKKNGAFKVLFYDGIEKSVQPFNVREMSAELKAQDFFKQFKAQIKASKEKNRKRERRKCEEAVAEEAASSSSGSSHHPQRLKRKFSPPPTPLPGKRIRYDSGDSSKTGSSIAEEKDASRDVDMEETEETVDESKRNLHWKQFVDTTTTEHEVHKVALTRGYGFFINNFIYIKCRDSSWGTILRCQNRNQCHAKGIIKKNGKALIKESKHNHDAPVYKDLEFLKPGADVDALDMSTESVESSPGGSQLPSPSTEGSVTPVIQMLTPGELEKMKERRKHIREPVTAPKALVIDLDHNKYKCEVPECGKSFRKATLLEYHKKYYHIKQTTPSATAASKALSRSRKRLSTSPPTSPSSGSSSRRSSAESGAPAKVTRSQRSSAPSELGLVSPTREAMSPPISSPAERKKSLDAKDRRREASGDRAPEVRVAKAPETRSPVETKAGKVPETRIPKSPETRIPRSSDGKFVRTTPEGRGSRSLSADSRSSPTADGRTRRVSAPDRTRQLSGSGVVKPPDTVSEHVDTAADVVGREGPKVGETEGKTSTSNVEVVGDIAKDSSKDINNDNNKDSSKDVNNKDTNNLDNKSGNDIVIKQEPEDVKLLPEPSKISETKKPADDSKQVIGSKVVASESRKEHAEVKVEKEKEKEGKSRSDRAKAKLKHKKKHKHKHDKGKEERSRDRHKERRRKSSEKTKLSDVEAAERSSASSVKKEPGMEGDRQEVKFEDASSGMEGHDDGEIMEHEEKELINCVCGYMEEEGFMLQCERCYCWQHGCCEGVNQSTAPKNYVCTFCRHPRGECVQSKYRYDQEWFDSGKLPRFKFVNQDDIPDRSSNRLTIHNLMADVHAVHDVLHGLQHKMMILKNPNHPELGLWARPWRSGEEWSFEDQAPSDMDISGQEADLSNIDHSNTSIVDHSNASNLDHSNMDNSNISNIDNSNVSTMDNSNVSNADTLPVSVNTSIQSVEAMDTSNQDADTSEVAMVTEETQTAGDIIGEKESTAPVVEPVDGSSAAGAASTEDKSKAVETPSASTDKTVTSGDKPKPTETDPSSEQPKPTDSQDLSDKAKDDCVAVKTADTKDQSTKEKAEDQSESKDPPSQPGTSEPVDKMDTDGGEIKTVKDTVESVKKDTSATLKLPVDTMKPPPGRGTNEPSISTSSSYAELSQLDPNQSPGSIFGVQASKPSTDEQSKPADSAEDPDKPGPSGLQQVVDVNQPGPSGEQAPVDGDRPHRPAPDQEAENQPTTSEQQTPIDPDIPGPSGLQQQQVDVNQPGPSGEQAPVDADIPGPSGLQGTNIPGPSGLQGTDVPGPSGLQGTDVPGPSSLQGTDLPGPSGLQGTDIPGPSGLQDTNIPGPSGLQDTNVPGPSGLQDTDIPSTSGEAHLLETGVKVTGVKVTGSSVWTAVQGGHGSNLPSTSAPVVHRPPIPPPAVCQANLMEHIQTMHEELFDRLALIEEQIEALEVAYAQKHQGTANQPAPSNEQESIALKRKMAVLMADLEKLSNIDLSSHN